MIEYKISYQNPNSHLLDIEVAISNIISESIIVNLPSWRPGRYELANYAKNILKFKVFSFSNEELDCVKKTKDSWEVSVKDNNQIRLKYSYYAFQMDAGNSWLDDEQLYLNPINCLIYIKERLDEKCSLLLDIPTNYLFASGLKETSNRLFVAKDYFELADSPIFSSSSLQCLMYSVDEIDFFVWIQGEVSFDKEKLLNDFESFSNYQIKMMKGFPEKEFHFLIQALPYSFRHGVEHRNSTVITIGPSHQIGTTLYKDLLGISAHELFHCWNVIKIRPKEMLPYDFSTENYFKTGYVAEGFTTYYGDLILARSKVVSLEYYFEELNDLLKKHLDNEGNLNLSLAESSHDLWLDGYVVGTPNRKVSIYIKGAVLAFILDITIRKSSQNIYSLDDLMRTLWEDYGSKGIGYEESTVLKILSEKLNVNAEKIIKKGVYECTFLEEELDEALDFLGLELKRKASPSQLEADFGVKCVFQNEKWLIDKISQNSPGINFLSRNDEIISINNKKFNPLLELNGNEITIMVLRGQRLITEILRKDGRSYNSIPFLSLKEKIDLNQKANFNKWLDL